MKSENNVEQAIKKKLSFTASTELHDRMLNDVLNAQEQSKNTKSAATGPRIGRIIMKSSITKLAAAAVIIIALMLSLNLWEKSIPLAAADILANATAAVNNLHSIHINARMRTLPRDNFAYISLEHDFVPIEMWKRPDDTGLVQWRIDKPGRLVLMDGESTILYIKPTFASKSGPSPNRYPYDSYWCGHILDVNKLLENELNKAIQIENAELYIADEKEIDGSDVSVVDITVPARVDKDDYLRNKFITDSDHRRVYCFDAETNLLKSFEIYVITEDSEVKIFETTNIEYNPPIDDSIFTLELSNDVVWDKQPEILPDNEKYQNMTPKEAAITFFTACAQEDWDEYLKFNSQSHVPQRTKDYLGGIEVISIGEPFQSGSYSGWFIPYEIKLRNGQVRKHNLALRNDNPANRWQVDGGL
jgi:outer membrane lipoprotein-sorting protein